MIHTPLGSRPGKDLPVGPSQKCESAAWLRRASERMDRIRRKKEVGARVPGRKDRRARERSVPMRPPGKGQPKGRQKGGGRRMLLRQRLSRGRHESAMNCSCRGWILSPMRTAHVMPGRKEACRGLRGRDRGRRRPRVRSFPDRVRGHRPAGLQFPRLGHLPLDRGPCPGRIWPTPSRPGARPRNGPASAPTAGSLDISTFPGTWLDTNQVPLPDRAYCDRSNPQQ